MAPNKKPVTPADFTEKARHQTAVNNAKKDVARKAECRKSVYIDWMDPDGALRRQARSSREQESRGGKTSVNSDSSPSSSSA
jgi:hypothetical protein